MFRRLGLAALFAMSGFIGGATLAGFAEGVPGTPSSSLPPLQVAASATSMQAFLWMLDRDARTVTFCFSTGSPDTGPQYDFGCKSKAIKEAVTP
jgi:hypothetical protein